MSTSLWTNCLQRLEQELSDQQLNTWIRPLQIKEESNSLILLAPNRFVLDWVRQNFQERIHAILREVSRVDGIGLSLEIGSQSKPAPNRPQATPRPPAAVAFEQPFRSNPDSERVMEHNLNPAFTFSYFVEGKSNQFAAKTAPRVGQG